MKTPKTPKDKSKKPKQSNTGEVEIIPPSSRDDNRRRVLSTTRITQTWNAPFLPPDVMKKYDGVVPNGAARLFQIFEEETAHRRQLERDSLGYQGRDLIVGKVLAHIFVLAVLIVIAFAIALDSPWVASVLGAGMLGTIVFGFLRVFGDPVPKRTKKEEPTEPPKTESPKSGTTQ